MERGKSTFFWTPSKIYALKSTIHGRSGHFIHPLLGEVVKLFLEWLRERYQTVPYLSVEYTHVL